VKLLDLVVGPNGAGKSTIVRAFIEPHTPNAVFVNADAIARERWPQAPEEHSYEAARVAARTRDVLIEQGSSFIAETVFSHPSKVELIDRAKGAGYTVVLHVVLVDPDTSVARVAARVAAGGHDVPEDKIRSRHQRLGPLLSQAIDRVDEAFVYDNTRIEGPRRLAWFTGGDPVGPVTWPSWVPPELAERWPARE
jgi:predicted ABC-type ATPase